MQSNLYSAIHQRGGGGRGAGDGEEDESSDDAMMMMVGWMDGHSKVLLLHLTLCTVCTIDGDELDGGRRQFVGCCNLVCEQRWMVFLQEMVYKLLRLASSFPTFLLLLSSSPQVTLHHLLVRRKFIPPSSLGNFSHCEAWRITSNLDGHYWREEKSTRRRDATFDSL